MHVNAGLLGLGGLDVDPGSGLIIPTGVDAPVDVNGWYCNSFVGQWLSPVECHIPSTNEIRDQVAKELASTSLPASAQDAALKAGDVNIAADMKARPQDYIAQNAASKYPLLSSIFGPSTVGDVGAINPDGSQSTPFLLYGILAAASIGLFLAFSKR